jgi:hypothetical protein
MGIFIVATRKQEHDELLKTKVVASFPSDYYEIGRGQWLVSFKGTARELYSKLVPEYTPEAPSKSPLDATVVFGIAGYWGVASRDMWDWITVKLGAPSA